MDPTTRFLIMFVVAAAIVGYFLSQKGRDSRQNGGNSKGKGNNSNGKGGKK